MNPTLRYEPVDGPTSRATADRLIAWLRDWGAEGFDGRLADQRRSFSPGVVLQLARQGLFGMTVGTPHQGLALRTVDWLRVFEQLAAIDIALSQLLGVSTIAMRPLVAFGSTSQQDRWLPQLATGAMLASYAQTEPSAGSDFTRMRAALDRRDGGLSLNADKTWIGNAGWAGLFTVFAHERAHDAQGLSAVLVPAETHGVRVGQELMTMGLKGVVQNHVTFDQVRLNDDDRLGPPGAGLQIAVDAMSITRLQIAASAVGGLKRCIQLACRFADRRQVATGRLLDHPMTRRTLSDLCASVVESEVLVTRAAARLDRGEPVSPEVLAGVKICATEAVCHGADRTLQLLGGRGYDEATGVPQLVRDSRVLRIFEGPSEPLLWFLGSRAGRFDDGVYRFLRTELGAAAIAERLRHHIASGPARAGATQAAAGILCLAALQLGATVAATPGEAATYARARAEERFEAAAAALSQPGATARSVLSATALQDATRAHATSIGEVDPQGFGEQRTVDPLVGPSEGATSSTSSTDSTSDQGTWFW